LHTVDYDNSAYGNTKLALFLSNRSIFHKQAMRTLAPSYNAWLYDHYRLTAGSQDAELPTFGNRIGLSMSLFETIRLIAGSSCKSACDPRNEQRHQELRENDRRKRGSGGRRCDILGNSKQCWGRTPRAVALKWPSPLCPGFCSEFVFWSRGVREFVWGTSRDQGRGECVYCTTVNDGVIGVLPLPRIRVVNYPREPRIFRNLTVREFYANKRQFLAITFLTGASMLWALLENKFRRFRTRRRCYR